MMTILAIIWNLIVLVCQLWLIRVALGLIRFIAVAIVARKAATRGTFNYYDRWTLFGSGYSIICENKKWEITIGKPEKEKLNGNN